MKEQRRKSSESIKPTTILEKLQAAVDLKMPPWETWTSWGASAQQQQGPARDDILPTIAATAAPRAPPHDPPQTADEAWRLAESRPLSEGSTSATTAPRASTDKAQASVEDAGNWGAITSYAERILPAFGIVGVQAKK